MQPQGVAERHLYTEWKEIEGTRKEPIVNGVLDFCDVTAAIEGINATLEKVNGFVNFKGKFFEFATKKALLDGDDLKLDLASNFDGKYKINVSSNKIKTSKIINIIETSPVLSLINKDFAELSCIKSIIGNSKIDFNLIGQYDIENNDFNIEKSKYKEQHIKPITDYDVELYELPTSFSRKDLEKLEETKEAMRKDSDRYSEERKNAVENQTETIDDLMKAEEENDKKDSENK